MEHTSTLRPSRESTPYSPFLEDVVLETTLSFAPLLQFLKEKTAAGGEENPVLLHIIRQFESIPGIYEPIEDISHHPHISLIRQLLEITFFPPSEENATQLFAFSIPWQFYPFHASARFREVLYHDILLSDETAFRKFRQEKLEHLYRRVLHDYYDLHIEGEDEFIYPFREGTTGVIRYFKVAIDMRFCRLKLKGTLPVIDKKFMENNFTSVCCDREFTRSFMENHFALEGFTVARVTEVTESAAVNALKNVLLESFGKSPHEHFSSIQVILQSLLGIGGVQITLVPFPKINNRLVLEDHHGSDGLLYPALVQEKDDQLFRALENHFVQSPQPLILTSVQNEDVQRYPFLRTVDLSHGGGYVLVPLIKRGHLLGVLELIADKPGVLTKSSFFRLGPAHVILIQLVSNYLHQFKSRVEKLIKENFTSLQPSVEWKFRETIHHFLNARALDPQASMEKLVFDNMYPFYGAVDIRDSSFHRSRSTQYDLTEQLQRVYETVTTLMNTLELPLLRALQFRSEECKKRIASQLTTEDELRIVEFIDHDVKEALQSVHSTFADVRPVIERYLATTDEKTGSYYAHRRRYESSVYQINNTLNQYLDTAHVSLQSFFPYYYEKYKTDGVEYNIYMGQALLPAKPFSTSHQKNLYLWQIRSMIDMARLTHDLLPSLPLPLQTTQLVLVYNAPVTISFRRDERKFDVDGAYNIRYEIMKKRIDKAHLKGSDERLTQPGRLAIIYSYQKDIELFDDYIDMLIREGALMPEKEYVELEELQGVTGLKALRVTIKFEEKAS